ncbi:hypothetical protein F66182_5335 [Fusarium sp. NRRL 66182]|nr:hypothetical protein F66182_5335 [Fusarium sp. NRRL 66182]
MGIKQFNLDLKAAVEMADNFPRVSNIRKGDSDGEIVFTYTPDTGLHPIDIQALSTDADSYPRHAGFLIFTSSDTAIPRDLEGWLPEISGLTERKSVTGVIALISRILSSKLHHQDETTSQMSFTGIDEADDQSTFYSDQASDYEEDEYMADIDPLPPTRQSVTDTDSFTSRESTLRLKRHLREAKEEGLHISVPFTDKRNNAFDIFSLSIRVSKLGIPEETLAAWDLKPAEYVAMLFRLPKGYPFLSDFLLLRSDQTTVQYRFGKCASQKPSYHSMRRMFEHADWKEFEEPNDYQQDDTGSFTPLSMSASLETLLNTEFPSLLRLRRSESISWDQAQEVKFQLSRNNHNEEGMRAPEKTDVCLAQDKVADWSGLEFLRRDYVLASGNDINILLVSMQFGLQRLIRCTKYCMVCHQKIDGEFEAVKPYVCGSSLCLHQYLSLGFGRSIEHEIISNPHFVDLLISFFYSSVSVSRLREFPRGLGLKCASSGFAPSPTGALFVDACFQTNTIRFESTDYASYSSIREGHYILVVVSDSKVQPSTPIMQGSLERYICIVDSCKNMEYTFRIVATYASPLTVEMMPTNKQITQATHPNPSGVEAMVFKYDQDIDDLPKTARDQALTTMINCIPSVHEMRDYLTQRPGRRLNSWQRMDASTLGLLHWIVASNRSHIVQDAPVPGSSLGINETEARNLVHGVDRGWLQFRFAQGSPDKEEVFLQELMRVGRAQGRGKQEIYHSLFAWHGSPLENWHSIIRTGLDFSAILNGRAYGNGVYLAKDFKTSSSYSTRSSRSQSKFVSTNPFFVIDKIEWIQCRYLFIQVGESLPQLAASEMSASDASAYLKQDPSHELTGNANRRISIPVSAISASRRRALGQSQVDVLGSAKSCPIVLDCAGDEILEDNDIEMDDLLASDDEDDGTQQRDTMRNRRRTSTDSGLGETRRFGPEDSGAQELDNVMPFQPGQTDLGSLPKLVEPTWASSSPAALRALNGQIKDLQKIQSKTMLSTLGWYIDLEKLDNLFHWIVELHSFDMNLPLAQDMTRHGCSSIVLELRFGASFPISPPFVRVVRPRFLPFSQGGGGHVTIGGAICSELLTNSGWSPALSLEKVFLEVRMNLCEKDPPARLDRCLSSGSGRNKMDYNMLEAVDAFRRAATAHQWQIPSDLEMMVSMSAQNH